MQKTYVFIVSFVLFLVFIVSGIMTYNNKDKKYRLRNHFPYELETEKTFPFLRCLFSLYIVSSMIFHFFYFLFFRSIHSPNFVQNIFLIFSLLLDLLTLMIFLSKISLSFKTHIAFASFYFALSLLINIYAIFYIYRSYYYSYYYMIYFTINFLVQLVLLLMPNMKKSFIVDQNDKEGRSKYNHFAFCEWLFIFLNIGFNFMLLLIDIIG